MSISILLVDDEPVLLDVMERFLKKNSQFRITTAESAIEAIEKLQAEPFDIILSDYAMPEMNGLELLKHVRSEGNETSFILFTGQGNEETAVEALNSGADFYLQKGGEARLQFTELVHMIERSVEARRGIHILKENEAKFRSFFNAASDSILILNQDEIIDLNKQTINLFDAPEEAILTHSLLEFSPEFQPGEISSSELLSKYLNQAYSGEIILFPWTIRALDGKIHVTEFNVVSIKIRNLVFLHAIIRDISSRIAEEERKKMNEDRLETMLSLYQMIESPLKKIADYALEHSVRITKSEFGCLAFIKGDQKTLEIYSWSENALKNLRIQQMPYTYEVDKIDLPDIIIQDKLPYIRNDASHLHIPSVFIPDESVRILNTMIIPVIDSGKIVILISLFNKKEEYNEEDTKQCTLLLNGLWGIIRRKKAEEELLFKTKELSGAYDHIAQSQLILDNMTFKLSAFNDSGDNTEPCLKILADDLPMYISYRDEAGVIKYANKTWRDKFSSLDNIHASWSLLLSKKDREKIDRNFSERFGKIEEFSLDYKIKVQSGKKKKILARYLPKITDDGKFIGYIECGMEFNKKLCQ